MHLKTRMKLPCVKRQTININNKGYNEEENLKNCEKIEQTLAKNLAYRAVKKLTLKVVFTIAGLILVATSVTVRIVQDQHCFRWTEYGQTIAGIGSRASGPKSLVLDHPNDLFVDDKKNVYVADVKNHRIQKSFLLQPPNICPNYSQGIVHSQVIEFQTSQNTGVPPGLFHTASHAESGRCTSQN
ncbi:unnamed protein product [Didymodactylos carnosus]|uniref:NHL repeat-containing protein n=1 Tax=Didymodactylos carnosus TaxID=1234261 RepID=A0A8S2UI61_9BILA|nr:unnamed protein product [Didymodactylos carnosus]